MAVAAGDEDDQRVDDVGAQRRDNGGERAADNDADGHVHHVSALDKLAELLNKVAHGILL